ncbi:DUF3618 domain-containing protein [Pseudonocardia sp. H11422]|uniref:DUF3618 domain-containing protein n=1 Tax=Pseudonocardia sp. H11422 TaxID=2835866 RepID=UPI001BDC2E37|nr:DUF3618 domain-containing protein [Pseudonocardia sp. H11422]
MSSASDPEQIRREIEQTQGRLSGDVDALSEKVTPGRIVERRVNRARGAVAGLKDRVMGSDPDPAYAVTGQVSPAHDRGDDSAATSAVSDAASAAASTVSDAASSTVQTMQAAPRTARRRTQGNPLAAGLIAFGAGWLISSLLPASRREQELATQAKDLATEHGQPLIEKVGEAAGEVRDNLREPTQQAVESVRSTAGDATSTVADQGQAAADQVRGQAQDAGTRVRDQSTT